MSNNALTDNDIIKYLNSDQDFFIRHPEQLESINVNNRNGTVTSLVNHQVNVLKERNTQLKNKLAELIKYAQENEKIMEQIFHLTNQLCQISHVANVTKHVGKFVKQSFDCDMFKMVIPVYENLENSSTVMCITEEKLAEFKTLFEEFNKRDKPICGRLKKQKLAFIFGKNHEKIGSSVILPIGKNAQKGLLIFASFDETRFNPEMSTDLLLKLTVILDHKFKNTF